MTTRHLSTLLQDLLGADGLLVLAVCVLGYSLREASEHLEISYEAGRKRYQRAIIRLRAVPEHF